MSINIEFFQGLKFNAHVGASLNDTSTTEISTQKGED